jgi:hypothetical protein
MAGNPIQRLRIPSVLRAPARPVEPDSPATPIAPGVQELASLQSLGEPTAGAVLLDAPSVASQPPAPLPDPSPDQLPESRSDQPSDQPPEQSPKATPSKAAQLKPVLSQLSSGLWRGVRLVGVPLTWLTLIALCAGTGWVGFWWLTALPPVADCKNLQPLSGDLDRLACAEQAARSGELEPLLKGLELVQSWGADHPLASQAKKLTLEWSKSILAIARSRADQNNLAGAIALAQKITSGNPLHKEAQAAIATWKQNRGQEKNYDSAIDLALKSQNWAEADAQLQTIARLEGDHWRQYGSRQRQRAIAERTARRQLEQVRSLIDSAAGSADIYAKAIALAQQISSNTYATPEVKTELARLNQTIIALVNTRIAQADLPSAIGLAQILPPEASLPPDVQSVLWLGRAQPLATNTLSFQPLSEQLWQFWMVLPMVQQVPADSPLAGPAQDLAARLQPKLEDLTQLQLASALASLAQVSTFQMAIDLAQTITPDRPQRLYAQSLIADWRKAIEQAEDRPYLKAARDLAKTGEIKQLKAAIVLAGRVPLGRALRPEAQSAIFDWQQQIQTIEDKPFLTEAKNLAKQNKLKEAIQATTKILPGRALSKDAQALAQEWTIQVQTTEDRPILDQANVLADQGSLGSAINQAAQIAPDRALYPEAQAAIDRWQTQLARIEAQREASRRPRRTDSAPDDSALPKNRRSNSTAPTSSPR